MIVFPNCKINLGLHIIRKRPDGFYDLETIFYPVLLQDALEIIVNPAGNKTELFLSGNTIDHTGDNICIKAYHLLKKDLPHLPAVTIHLHKAIPIGAGLGGGSADGASMLQLLNKKLNLGMSEQQLLQYALQLGSDCPFFIKNKPCLAHSRGEDLKELAIDLSAYKIVIVNPGIHINTGWAFSQIQPKEPQVALATIIQQPITEWKEALVNDFEVPIFLQYPAIKECKEVLYQKGALYASMSGSGSTVYGIFPKEQALSFSFPPHYFVKER